MNKEHFVQLFIVFTSHEQSKSMNVLKKFAIYKLIRKGLDLAGKRVCQRHPPPFEGISFSSFEKYRQKYRKFDGISCYLAQWLKTTKNPPS
jgi:hypothetical protein